MDHKVIHEHSLNEYYDRIQYNYNCFSVYSHKIHITGRMTHITTVDSRVCYQVEKLDDSYYYPYLTTSGLCVKITDDGATYFLRGKECDRVVFGHPDEVRLFFNHLGAWYDDCICFMSSSPHIRISGIVPVHKWSPSTKIGIGDLTIRGDVAKSDASALDVCVEILDAFSSPYFVFKFDGVGLFAFSRDEIKRYKKTGHL